MTAMSKTVMLRLAIAALVVGATALAWMQYRTPAMELLLAAVRFCS